MRSKTTTLSRPRDASGVKRDASCITLADMEAATFSTVANDYEAAVLDSVPIGGVFTTEGVSETMGTSIRVANRTVQRLLKSGSVVAGKVKINDRLRSAYKRIK